MLFSSLVFIFRFLILFMLIYFLTPEKYRNMVLFAGSIIFYAAGEPRFVMIMLGSVCLNYVFYLLIRKSAEKRRKLFLVLMLIFNFALLFVFKYWDFAAGTLQTLSGHTLMPLLKLALPLGISFYTFQIVSLQADSYRALQSGQETEQIPFLTFATYIIMFPQLVAGPILKYDEVATEMKHRICSAERTEDGFKLFIFGLALKVLLANKIGTLWLSVCMAGMDSLSVPMAWLGAFSYSFQIYFDFWGYSLMAMGLGEMLGFHFPENFHDPYLARTMTGFWRRWHITLGRWFREYVYIPMGGSRCSCGKTFRNILVVWALTGLWHGASWNFVLWGLLFFVLISLEKAFYGKYLERNAIAGHLYMIILIPVTWVIFAITDFGNLVSYLRCMIGMPPAGVLTGADQFLRYLRQYGLLLGFCVLFSTALPMMLYQKYRRHWWMLLVLFAAFVFSVYEIANGSSNPFLYFRF